MSEALLYSIIVFIPVLLIKALLAFLKSQVFIKHLSCEKLLLGSRVGGSVLSKVSFSLETNFSDLYVAGAQKCDPSSCQLYSLPRLQELEMDLF